MKTSILIIISLILSMEAMAYPLHCKGPSFSASIFAPGNTGQVYYTYNNQVLSGLKCSHYEGGTLLALCQSGAPSANGMRFNLKAYDYDSVGHPTAVLTVITPYQQQAYELYCAWE